MHTTIINDCRDTNAVGRQVTRVAVLSETTVSFIGVNSDLEAAGNLIDAIDAFGNNQGLILVNVAPRNGKAKKWENGTPFGYFTYKNITVLSSIDGYTLSLVKKFNLAKTIRVLDTKEACEYMVSNKYLDQKEGKRITLSQFRSYDFTPRVALLLKNKLIPSAKILPIEEVADAPEAIWWVDNFGNCKTTITSTELNLEDKFLKTKFGQFPFYPRLKDVPDKKIAAIIGSSGLGEKRFIEIVVQGGRAVKEIIFMPVIKNNNVFATHQ